MPTRLLAIGDIHLGRTLRRLPDRLQSANLGPAAALRTAVDTALSLRVSAVLLAGDVADREHDLYHAHGVLTDELGRLGTAGIPVLAVAGNHDHETLPRLARALPDLQIVGHGGTWESVRIVGDGGPVDVLGWSFPSRHHTASPALGLPRVDGGVPTVGLLHADLDAVRSNYAPVKHQELEAAGPVRWLLGHIHQPSLSPDHGLPGYLGSLVGLHPNETGPRGPWLVSVDSGHVALEHLQHAAMRWVHCELPVDELADPRDELLARLNDTLREAATAPTQPLDGALAVGVRITLVGRAADHAALTDMLDELPPEPMHVTVGDQVVFLDAVTCHAHPMHDLDDLARHDNPPGLLARELLALQQGQARTRLDQARARLRTVDLHGSFGALTDRTHTDEQLTEQLLQAGYAVLDRLLRSHQEDGHGPA